MNNILNDLFQIDGMWVELEDVKSGRAQMSLEWREVSLDSPLLRASSAEDRELAKCLLHVYVDSAKEVYAKGGDKPSPMAQIRVGQASRFVRFKQHNPLILHAINRRIHVK